MSKTNSIESGTVEVATTEGIRTAGEPANTGLEDIVERDMDNGLDEEGNPLYQIENIIEKYTDKSRYEEENIFDDVYVDSARMAESKKSNQERLNFERELASAKRFSEHFDCEVYLLPPKEAGSVIYKTKHSNPDAIVNGSFIDFKENNSGNEGTIKNLFDKATKQADAVYLTLSGGTTLGQAVKWINGKLSQKGNIEGFGVVLSDSNGNFAEYKVKEKRLIESPFIRETGTKSSFIYNYNANTSNVKIEPFHQKDSSILHQRMMDRNTQARIDADYEEVENALRADPSNFDSDGNHLAPNGKKSNLTYKQWVQVRTPAFKNWFGD